MRVISGKARGTRLTTMEGMNTRPTTDRIKESIFNLIQFDIPGSKVLDLFAGSGALGLEAASRGAESVDLVEVHRKCHKVIEENIKKCRFENVSLIKGEVLSALERLSEYDVILMDPPYNKGHIEPVLEKIEENNILSSEGIIMVEHSQEDELDDIYGNLSLLKRKQYGITVISIYGYDE